MRLYEVVSESDDIVFDTGTPWYHGSRVDGFWEFDQKYLGSGIVNVNASGGFYFSTDRDAAAYFADTESQDKENDEPWEYDDINVYGTDGEFYFVVGEEPKVNRGPFHTEEKAIGAGRQAVDEYNAAKPGETFYYDDKIVAVYLALGEPLVVNSKDAFRWAERNVDKTRYHSILAKDITDGYGTMDASDIAVVFDPKRIRII